jgi:hypothetical protein
MEDFSESSFKEAKEIEEILEQIRRDREDGKNWSVITQELYINGKEIQTPGIHARLQR